MKLGTRIFIGLLLAVVVARLHEFANISGPIGPAKVLIVIGVLLAIFRKQEYIIEDKSLPVLVALLVILSGFSIAWSSWRAASLGFFITAVLVNAALFYIVMRLTQGIGGVRYVAKCLLATGLFFALFLIVAGGGSRIGIARMYDPNDTAHVLSIIIAFAVVPAIVTRGFARLAWIFVALVLGYGIVLTQSRGGLLAALLVVAYLMLEASKHRRAKTAMRLKMVLVAFVGAIVLWQMAPIDAQERFLTLLNLEDDYNVRGGQPSSGRLDIWSRGISGILERPWGWGVGAYQVLDMSMGGRFKAAHSAFIQIGGELGVIGLGIFIGLLRVAFVRLGRARKLIREASSAADDFSADERLALSMQGAMVGYLMSSLFLSQAYSYALFLLLALTHALWTAVSSARYVAAGGREMRPLPRPHVAR